MIRDDLFWSKVDKTGPCWTWQATRNENGYGILRRASFAGNGPRNYLAHRYALMLLGLNFDDKQVDHICHNPACVRYFHLRLATNKQNHEHLKGANVNSTSGIRGVGWDKARGKWRAQVKHNYTVHSKRFSRREDAEAWAVKTRLELFTFNATDRA